MAEHNEIGKLGEILAKEYLENKGYRILAKNWSCVHGEIDIIAQTEGIIVFTEVKTRSGEQFGRPEEAVSNTKLEKLALSAEFYLSDNKIDKESRLDVISVIIYQDKKTVNHFIEVS